MGQDEETQRAADWRPAVAAALGSICVGTVPAMALGLYAQGVTPVSLLFWRYAIALVVLVPLALATTASLTTAWRHGGRGLFLNGLTLGALQTFCYFRAIQSVPSSIVITIFFAYPICTLLIDRFVLRIPVAGASALAALIVLAGVGLTGWPQLTALASGTAGVDVFGLALAVATPLVYSIYLAISHRFALRAEPFAAATFIYGALALSFLGAASLQGMRMPADAVGWGTMAAIAIVGGALQISAFAYALPRLAASGYAIIVSLELVTVASLGVLLLGERLTPIQATGLTLVVVGVIVDRLWRKR